MSCHIHVLCVVAWLGWQWSPATKGCLAHPSFVQTRFCPMHVEILQRWHRGIYHHSCLHVLSLCISASIENYPCTPAWHGSVFGNLSWWTSRIQFFPFSCPCVQPSCVAWKHHNLAPPSSLSFSLQMMISLEFASFSFGLRLKSTSDLKHRRWNGPLVQSCSDICKYSGPT